jgi:hypothetical protein
MHNSDGGMGVGVVGRDHLGACLVACQQFYSMLPKPEFAEAMALRQAASLAHEKGLEQVIFATHYLSLVQHLEIKIVAKDLTSTSFIHIKRELKEAARPVYFSLAHHRLRQSNASTCHI